MPDSKYHIASIYPKLASIIPLILAIILIIATCGGSLNRALVNNAWSLNFVQYVFHQKGLLPAPQEHTRAPIWLARDAMAHNDIEKAQTLVLPLATSGNIQALAILGDTYLAQGQFAAAVSAWSAAGEYDSLISAAAIARDESHPEEALLALQNAFAINPEESTDSLATLYLETINDPEKAATLLRDAIQQYPKSVHQSDWCSLMGRVFTKEKKYPEADDWYARAVSIDPNLQDAWILRANSARASGDLPRAIDLYGQAAKEFPQNASIYYEMAQAYKLANLPANAVQAIEKAIQFTDPANIWYELRAGQIYESAGSFDQAEKAYLFAQSIDPGNGTAPLVSFYRFSLKDTDKAIATLTQAIKNYPTVKQCTSWMLQLAGMYRDAKSWADARSVYQQILTTDPKNMDALVGLGWVQYYAENGFSSAQADFQKAIQAAPDRGDGYFAMGQALSREMRFAEADPWFAQAIERAPENQNWWIERGNALRSAGSLEKAIQIYTQATKRFQNFASGYYELAWAYRLNNDKEQSVQAIEVALKIISPPNEYYFVRAGLIYEWVGSKDKAITAYRDALAINPDNSNALGGLTRLSQ